MSKIIKITAFFLFFVMCFCVKNVSAAVSLHIFDTFAECAANCSTTCVEDHLTNIETGEIVSTYYRCGGTVSGSNECTAGSSQSKYTASGCTYTTSTRNCCSESNFTKWSGWGEKCCTKSSKPAATQSCTNSAGYTGIQSRTVTCNRSTGSWTTGSWSSCSATQICDPGDTRSGTQYCSNKNHVQKCNSSGTSWGSCSCPNQGGGKVYCQGMPITVAEASTCLHGIWSDTTCTGICCCSGDTPKLMSNGTPGCWGTQRTPGMENGFGGLDGGMQTWKGSCVCQIKSQMSDRLPNLM